MEYNINDKITFGQYKGLTIKEIYQGTLNIDRDFIEDFLRYMILTRTIYDSDHFQFIEDVKFNMNQFEVIYEIFNPELPIAHNNRMSLGNIENILQLLVDNYFNPNFWGILKDIRSFNGDSDNIRLIGGDPEYLLWCERTIQEFNLSIDCKNKLANITSAKLIGINVMYIDKEFYDYCLDFKLSKPWFDRIDQNIKS